MKIVVIGAGFGGLAAAVRLAAQGHDVTVIDKHSEAGGRAAVYRQDGFTFDAGPTIITAPWLLDDLFALSGRRTADYVTLVALDPFYNVRFTDGSVFRYTGRHDEIVSQIRAFNPGDVAGYEKFASRTAEIFRTGFALIDRPFLTIADMLRVAPDLLRLQSWRSVAGYVNRFISDERLRQVFSFHPLLVGGNPFSTTSIYTLIHHLEKQWGVWFAMGGTGALVQGLVRLLGDLGGRFVPETEATQIAIDPTSRRATGVHTATGSVIPADAVVSNADVYHTYQRLIPAWARRTNTDRRLARKRYSMSLFVLYFGTDRVYDDMAHHEILMGPRYKGLLHDIFDTKRLSPDFSLYLHRPSATDRSLAPPGCDAWYVLSPVPNLAGATDWDVMGRQYRDAIVGHLERHYLPGLSRHIVTERMIDPRHFRDSHNSYLGNAFALEPVLTQSAWFRPHNVSEDVPNLYLAGAGTHPGAGLPGVISSGKIVADLIGPATT